MSHADFRKKAAADHTAKLAHHAGSGGTAKNDSAMVARAMREDRVEDKKMITRAIGEHEAHDHKGSGKTKLRLATGGRADDDIASSNLGRARGGRSPRRGGHKGTNVNVIVAPHPGGGAMPMPMGPPPGGPPPMMPPHPAVMPPPGGAPMGAPPPGLGAMPPRPMPGPPVGAGVPGMRRRGGRAGFARGGVVETEGKSASGPLKNAPTGAAGAGSGAGRLAEAKSLSKKDNSPPSVHGLNTGGRA